MKPKYILVTAWGAGPCDLDDVIALVDNDHAEPLRALDAGEEYEIPLPGTTDWRVKRLA